MTAEASVDNSKIEAICRECGNTLPASEVAEFFNEEQLILNFWSCTNCGFQFETEEKIRSEAASQIDESDEEAGLFPETFFHHRDFECASVQAVGYEDAIGISALPPKADMCGALAHVRYGPKADISPYSIISFAQAMSVSGSQESTLKLRTHSSL